MTSEPGTGQRQSRFFAAGSLRSTPVACALYLLLAIWSTWPVVQVISDAIPGGRSTASGTVPLLNLWTISWNSDRALRGLRGYWHAPIFHPTQSAFAFSEPQPVTLVVAPIIWMTGSRTLAYNVYLLGSLVLNGVFARRLLRSMGVSHRLALAGGAAMLLLPIVHWQIDVLQLVPLWGILWSWDSALRVSQCPTTGRGAILGLALGTSFLICAHSGLLLGLLLPATVWVLPRRWRKGETWLAGASALVVSAAIILPIALPMRSALAGHHFDRNKNSVIQLSAFPGDYTAGQGIPLVNVGLLKARPEWRLSPGLLISLLAITGVALGLSRRRWRRWTIYLTITGLLAIALSLGPNLRFGTFRPWWSLTSVVPGLALVRNVFRFSCFMQMATIILGIQGIHLAWTALRRKPRAVRGIANGFLAILVLLAIFENRPAAAPCYAVPDYESNQDWIDFVRKEASGSHAILHLPFEETNDAVAFEPTARWMCLQSWHHAAMVNGYSGFFPKGYFELRKAVQQAWDSDTTWRRLSDAGVELIVVDRRELKLSEFSAKFANGEGLTLAFADDRAGFDVYRLPDSAHWRP